MRRKLVADGGADEVRAVRVEAVPDEQIHTPEIDEAEIHCELLAVGRFHARSIYHLIGWYMDGIVAHSRRRGNSDPASSVAAANGSSGSAGLVPRRAAMPDARHHHVGRLREGHRIRRSNCWFRPKDETASGKRPGLDCAATIPGKSQLPQLDQISRRNPTGCRRVSCLSAACVADL